MLGPYRIDDHTGKGVAAAAAPSSCNHHNHESAEAGPRDSPYDPSWGREAAENLCQKVEEAVDNHNPSHLGKEGIAQVDRSL